MISENAGETQSGVRLFNQNELNQIGEKHNFFLEEIFKDFDFSVPEEDYSRQLKERFDLTFAKHFPNENTSEITTHATVKLDDHLEKFNKKERTYVENALNFLNGSHNEIKESMRTISQQVIRENNLNNFEKNRILTTLVVMQYSSKFWLPKSKGGNGRGYEILQYVHGEDLASLRKDKLSLLEEVLAADGISAGSSLIIGAVAAAISGGPVGVGMFFGLIGAKAALASGWAAILYD